MSIQSTARANAIEKDFNSVIKDSQSAVSKIVAQTALVSLWTVFMHDNLLNGTGDLSEGDRIDFKNGIVPLYPQLEACISDIEVLNNIYSADPATWQANLDAYLVDNPTLLAEARSRFPVVG